MMQITPEQSKINKSISEKLGVPISEVEKAIDLYFKGVHTKMKEGKPVEIIMPYLGKLYPSKTFLKRLKEQDETSST